MRVVTVLSIVLSMVWGATSVMAHTPAEKTSRASVFTGVDTPAGQTVLAFHKALEAGDQATAREVLADDVLIFEGGGVERSEQEYASHHMLADMRYMQAVQTETLEHHVTVQGSLAWSVSRSHTTGVYKGKEIDYRGLESIVLEKRQGQWQIVHIHWSR